MLFDRWQMACSRKLGMSWRIKDYLKSFDRWWMRDGWRTECSRKLGRVADIMGELYSMWICQLPIVLVMEEWWRILVTYVQCQLVKCELGWSWRILLVSCELCWSWQSDGRYYWWVVFNVNPSIVNCIDHGRYFWLVASYVGHVGYPSSVNCIDQGRYYWLVANYVGHGRYPSLVNCVDHGRYYWWVVFNVNPSIVNCVDHSRYYWLVANCVDNGRYYWWVVFNVWWDSLTLFTLTTP